MSKEQKPNQTEPLIKPGKVVLSYSIHRKDNGYFIIRHTIQNAKEIDQQKVSEPNFLAITMGNLEKFIRREEGI